MVQGHKDEEKEDIIHISKTVGHKNINILISIAVIHNLNVWNQDVIQAHIQPNHLARYVYAIPDQIFGLPLQILLKLLNLLYVLTESGHYRFDKYVEKIVKFQYTLGDLSFYHHKIAENLLGILGIYVDNTLAVEIKFMKLKDKIPDEFESNPRAFAPFLFTGVMINQ